MQPILPGERHCKMRFSLCSAVVIWVPRSLIWWERSRDNTNKFYLRQIGVDNLALDCLFSARTLLDTLERRLESHRPTLLGLVYLQGHETSLTLPLKEGAHNPKQP